MIKKIILTLIVGFMIISCGKKGNPVFEDSKASKIYNILSNKA